ncbi:hypothetical protein, partial [Escherichia coli]|uniref:hypothetical protein n=1 Tax=Escherichia coli TaxID=562 RepID=UPI001BCB08DF
QNDVTLKMPAFEWVHVQLHQQKGMISLSPPTICNSAGQILGGLSLQQAPVNHKYILPEDWHLRFPSGSEIIPRNLRAPAPTPSHLRTTVAIKGSFRGAEF